MSAYLQLNSLTVTLLLQVKTLVNLLRRQGRQGLAEALGSSGDSNGSLSAFKSDRGEKR